MKTMMMGMATGLVLVAGTAFAQSNGGQSNAAQVEQLHQALHLSVAQDAAWQLYRSAADVPDKAQARRRAASSLFRTVDSPHRMDLVEAEMRQELDDLQRQSRALKSFYATLSPEQQHTFDVRTLPPEQNQQY